MRRLGRWLGWFFLGIAVLLIGAIAWTARWGDAALWPAKPGQPSIEIYLVSHGYHSGLVISRAQLANVAARQGNTSLVAVAQRFAAHPYLEFGWGDEGFYRNVPDVGSVSVAVALRALLQPGNRSVVHVVGLNTPPPAAFPSADIMRIPLSTEGFSRLLDRLDASFAILRGQPEPLGPAQYGSSQFFRGLGSFHHFNVCNHWVGRLLTSAGLPVAPVLATLPAGLLLDLRWRAGLSTLPR